MLTKAEKTLLITARDMFENAKKASNKHIPSMVSYLELTRNLIDQLIKSLKETKNER